MLHLAYWWLFILLHRPFFRRKGRPIASMDREIDHVKVRLSVLSLVFFLTELLLQQLCRRAAENIMENLATWRSLYSLRYCPITLIQTVFSAGTVYLLTATQASSGIRIAWKDLDHSTKKLDCVMDYLQEIGASWQCATNIAGILKGLMQDQPRLLLNGKAMDIHHSLQLPSEHDDEPASQSYRDRMPLRKEVGPRSRSRANSNSKTKRRGSQSSSRGPSIKQTVGQESEILNISVTRPSSIPSSTQNQTLLQASEPVNIMVQVPSSPPSVSGSPASQSFIEGVLDLPQYVSPTSISPTSSFCDINGRRDSSPSTSLDPSIAAKYYANPDQHLWDDLRAFEEYPPTSPYTTQIALGPALNSAGPSGSSSQLYSSAEVTGFTGMLGGQALSQFPSFGIPINANGPFLLNPPGPSSNHFYLAEGISTDRLQPGSLDGTSMDDFELLME